MKNCDKKISRDKINDVINNCEIYARHFPEGRGLYWVSFSRVHLDVIGPLQRKENGNRFIVVTIDATRV